MAATRSSPTRCSTISATAELNGTYCLGLACAACQSWPIRRLTKASWRRSETLKPIAARHGVSPAQVALAWLLGQDGIIVFPKASNPDHVRENRAALDLKLTDEDLKDLDQVFRPPRKKVKLQSR